MAASPREYDAPQQTGTAATIPIGIKRRPRQVAKPLRLPAATPTLELAAPCLCSGEGTARGRMTSHSPQSPDNAGFRPRPRAVCAIVNMGRAARAATKSPRGCNRRCKPAAPRLMSAASEGRRPDPDGPAGGGRGPDVVAAVGGDGTVAAVASALVGTGAAMVIPAAPSTISRATSARAKRWTRRWVFQHPTPPCPCVGDVNGMIFLNNISFGAYPEILRRRESIYRRWGRSAHRGLLVALIAVWNLRHPLHPASVPRARAAFTTALAFVAWNAYQLLRPSASKAPDPCARGILRCSSPARESHGRWFGRRCGWPSAKRPLAADFDLICADEMQIRATPAHEYIAHDGEKTWMDSPFHGCCPMR